MKTLIINAVVIYFALNLFAQNSQNNTFLVKVKPEQRVSLTKLDYSSKNENIIYITKNYDFLVDASISPDNKYIAVIEYKNGIIDKERAYYKKDHLPTQNIVIIDPNGNVIKNLNKDVQKFVWNKKGNKIAFITGIYWESAECCGGFKPQSTYIYDINSDNLQQLDINNPTNPEWGKPYDLHWLENDSENALYFERYSTNKDEWVVKYDIEKKQVLSANTKSIHFSPDGKYYYLDAIQSKYNYYEDYGYDLTYAKHNFNGMLVFEAGTNKPIMKYSKREMGRLQGWIFNDGHYLLFAKKEKIQGEKKYKHTTYIQDVKKMTVDNLDGEVLQGRYQWVSSNSHLIMKKVGAGKSEILKMFSKEDLSINDIKK